MAGATTLLLLLSARLPAPAASPPSASPQCFPPCSSPWCPWCTYNMESNASLEGGCKEVLCK